MKKFFLTALAATLIAPFGVPAAELIGKVNTRKLNLRLSPTLQSPVAGKIKAGTEVKILRIVNNWAEIQAPESLPVYVSEARINPDGTLNGELNMRCAKAASAACLGTLPKGSKVTRIDDRANGWVRIVPPADLKVYAAALCLEFDRSRIAADGSITEDASAAAAAPAIPAESGEKSPETAPAPEAAPAATAAPAAPDAAGGVQPVSLTGTLVKWKYSRSAATDYVLLDAPNGRSIAFIDLSGISGETPLDVPVSVTGTPAGNNEAGSRIVRATSVVPVKTEEAK